MWLKYGQKIANVSDTLVQKRWEDFAEKSAKKNGNFDHSKDGVYHVGVGQYTKISVKYYDKL